MYYLHALRTVMGNARLAIDFSGKSVFTHWLDFCYIAPKTYYLFFPGSFRVTYRQTKLPVLFPYCS